MVEYRRSHVLFGGLHCVMLNLHQNHSSAFEASCDMIFLGVDNLVTRQSFQSLFPIDDCIDELELSRIHQAVLGLKDRELSKELSSSRTNEIDKLDCRNRSALSWAALKGDCEAVSKLIAAGADVNLADTEGNTALMHSLQSKNTTCMVALLQAGANAMAKNYLGRDALWYAIENLDPVDCMGALMTAGIDIAGKDVKGASPLNCAIVHNDCSWVSVLLEKGVDIEVADDYGDTALMDSLFFGSDDALKLLLQYGADYTKTDSYGDPTLHDVAIYGGLRTVEIVHAAELKGIDIYATNRQGKTALEMAQNRQAKPDGFEETFESLLTSIRARGPLSPTDDYIDGNSLDHLQSSQGKEAEDVWSDALETQTS